MAKMSGKEIEDKNAPHNVEHAAQGHPFHLVDPSPWPMLTSLSLLVLAIGGVLFMHHISKVVFFIGLLMLVGCAVGWFRDIIKESNTPGVHTKEVQNGLKIGMGLFIASEMMLFVAFFWGYFHSAMSPNEATGFMWPPKGIITLDPFGLPYLNTLLLLLSGTTITWAHHSLLDNNKKDMLNGLMLTVALGVIFSFVQGLEYHHASFALKDGIYPSSFYMATGFHGAHVIVGTLMILVCYFRGRNSEFTPTHLVGFEAAAWYWHFVDVVWLFLFVSIYWWGFVPSPAA